MPDEEHVNESKKAAAEKKDDRQVCIVLLTNSSFPICTVPVQKFFSIRNLSWCTCVDV